MNNERRRKATIAALIVLALISGLVGGYFAAHRGQGGVLAPPGRAGAMNEMSGMPATTGKPNQEAAKEMSVMKDMPGMSSPSAPPGAVVLPAVQRQLIGVRT